MTPKLPNSTNTFPPIIDNAKGVEPEQMCQIFVVANNGKKFQFPPTERRLLEAGIAFDALYHLHRSTEGGLKRIWVEVCEGGVTNAT